jgi:hypothetical protein
MLLVSPQFCVQPRSDCHTIVTSAGPSSFISGILIARNTSHARPIAMKQPNAFLKAAVLLSSVLLLSAFVCYRAGAFDRFLRNSAPPADSAVDALPQENVSDGSTSEGTDGDRTIMYSSKSIIIRDTTRIHTRVVPNTAQPEPPAQPDPPAPKATERSMLPGPKSFGPIIGLPPSPNRSSKPSP